MATRTSSPVSEALLWKGRMSRDNRVLLNSNTDLASQVKALTARVVAAEEAAKNVKTLSDRLGALEADDNEMHEVFKKLDEDRGHRLRILEEKAVTVVSKLDKVTGRVNELQTDVEEMQAQGEEGEAGNATRLEHLEITMRKIPETIDGLKRELSSNYESTIGETGGLRRVLAKLEKEVRMLAQRPVHVAPVLPPPAMALTRAINRDFTPEDEEDVLPIPPKRPRDRPLKNAKASAKRVIEKDDILDQGVEERLLGSSRSKDQSSTNAQTTSGKQSATTTAKTLAVSQASAKRQAARSARQVTASFTNTRVPLLEPQVGDDHESSNPNITDLPTDRPPAKGRAIRTSRRLRPSHIITDDAPKTYSEMMEEQEAEGRRKALNALAVHAFPQQPNGIIQAPTTVGRGRKRGQQGSPMVSIRSRTTRGGQTGSSVESQVNYALPLKLYREVDELPAKPKSKPRTTKAQPKRKLSDLKEDEDTSSRTASGSPEPPAKRVRQTKTKANNVRNKNVTDANQTAPIIDQKTAGVQGQGEIYNQGVGQAIQTHNASRLPPVEATSAMRAPTDLPDTTAAAFAGNLTGAMTTPVIPINMLSSSSTSSKPRRKRIARMPNLPPTPELRPQPDEDDL